MLDTNVCIAAMRAAATSSLLGRFNRHATQICISSIVLAELRYGAERSQRVVDNHDEIDQFVGRLEQVVAFDDLAAAEFGRVRVETMRQTIGPMDTLIAAHARSRSLILVTRNASEFSRVPGLQIEDWPG